MFNISIGHFTSSQNSTSKRDENVMLRVENILTTKFKMSSPVLREHIETVKDLVIDLVILSLRCCDTRIQSQYYDKAELL